MSNMLDSIYDESCLKGAIPMRFAVKEIREEKGMTLEELSRISGVPVSEISNMEENLTDVCSTSSLSKLAKALGVPVASFFYN